MRNWKTDNPIEAMMLYEYEEWYNQNIKNVMSIETKEALLKKLSQYSLYNPLTVAGVKIPHEKFPELQKFSNTKEFTGFQLYVVFVLLFEELHGGLLE